MERAVHVGSWCIDARCNRVGPDYNGLACLSPPPQSPEPPPPVPSRPSRAAAGRRNGEEEEEEEEPPPPPPPHVDEDDEHHHDHEEEEEEEPPRRRRRRRDGDDGDDGEHSTRRRRPPVARRRRQRDDVRTSTAISTRCLGGSKASASPPGGSSSWSLSSSSCLCGWSSRCSMRWMLTRRSGMPIYSRFESKDGRTDNGGIDMGQMNGASAAAHGEFACGLAGGGGSRLGGVRGNNERYDERGDAPPAACVRDAPLGAHGLGETRVALRHRVI